jgi:cytochrome c556
MRLLIGTLALTLTVALFAQQKGMEQPKTTKEIMTKMAIPASDALFAVKEKPTAQDWADYRKQGQILIDAAALLQQPGMIASGPTKAKAKAGAANPAAWNKAAGAMGAAGKAAIAAADKKDVDKLTGDVGGMILDSCSGCHDQYMIK